MKEVQEFQHSVLSNSQKPHTFITGQVLTYNPKDVNFTNSCFLFHKVKKRDTSSVSGLRPSWMAIIRHCLIVPFDLWSMDSGSDSWELHTWETDFWEGFHLMITTATQWHYASENAGFSFTVYTVFRKCLSASAGHLPPSSWVSSKLVQVRTQQSIRTPTSHPAPLLPAGPEERLTSLKKAEGEVFLSPLTR